MSQHNLPVRQVYKGETIFKQGASADHMFIIKEGKVDIHLSRDDKTIHLSTLERGAFFGEMALISDSPRSATATALEYTELYVIDSQAIDTILDKTNPIIRHMLKTMVTLVKAQNIGAARSASETPKLVAYAHLIEMVAAEGGGATDSSTAGAAAAGGAAGEGSGGAASGQESRVTEKRIVDRAGVFFGDSRAVCQATLRFMDSLNLLRLDGAHVRTNARTLVERTQKLPPSVTRGLDDLLTSEQELMELAEVEQVMKVDRQELLQNLSLLEGIEDLVAFRRAAVMRTMQEKGRAFFSPPTSF